VVIHLCIAGQTDARYDATVAASCLRLAADFIRLAEESTTEQSARVAV
jgi:hypothetical protein